MKNKITPDGRICRPVAIKYTEGKVSDADALLRDDGCATLTYDEGGKKPYICIDLGPASPGGYPVFEVEFFENEPTLRLSYSDWYDYICDPVYRDKGDFTRGTCKYLGPELPVLPANPDRFELYNICRTGKYIYPLVQGQQRFVLITLDTPGSVSLRSFHIYYTSSLLPYDGGFSSSSSKLDYLWDASIYTVQLATISNSQSLERAEGRLLVRTLTKGNDATVLKCGTDWSDYTLTLKCEAVKNPHTVNSIRWTVRAEDRQSGYVFSLSLCGEIRLYLRKNGVNREIARKKLSGDVTPNRIYTVTTRVEGNLLTVKIGDFEELTFRDSTYGTGTIGFCQSAESWSVIHALTVESLDGETLFRDDPLRDTTDYEYSFAEEFIADGAKRDRLPWVGDLYWADENVFYAFGDYEPIINTIEMFRRHQCPDGFVWGTCYPENRKSPADKDYGMYQSDIFSAWYIITVAYYYLFTGRDDKIKLWYDSVKADAEYLIDNIDGSGLFYQRFETSKGLWDHCLNDYGYYSYNNLIVAKALCDTAFLAKALGRSADCMRYETLARELALRTHERFFDTESGLFRASAQDEKPHYLATAFAFAFGMIDEKYAARTVQSLCAIHEKEFQMGKTVILFMKGCFRYGFPDAAYKTLTGSTGALDYLGSCTLNWIDAVRDEKGSACTTECMPYSKNRTANGACWNDSSHPDTAVAFLMSGYILGIRPTAAGYRTFRFSPNPCGLSFVSGSVPTPYGTIDVSYRVDGNVLTAEIKHPPGIAADILIPEHFREQSVIKTVIK